MAPINKKPFLSYQISQIRKYYPQTMIYLLTHYKSSVIESYFKNEPLINVIKEDKPLGTGGSIKNAINYLELNNNDSLLIINGDTFIEPNFADFINRKYSDITLMTKLENNCDRVNTLKINNSKIEEFFDLKAGEKNAYISVGCYFFKNLSFFKNIEEDVFSIEMKFKEYVKNQSLDAFIYNGVFIDIGIPTDYIKMNSYVIKNEIR